MANLNVKKFMIYLENAISMINDYDNEFGVENEEEDLRTQLGMTEEDIVIYQNRENIPEDLIVPITFIEDDTIETFSELEEDEEVIV